MLTTRYGILGYNMQYIGVAHDSTFIPSHTSLLAMNTAAVVDAVVVAVAAVAAVAVVSAAVVGMVVCLPKTSWAPHTLCPLSARRS
jgi:hypothetical protein